MIYMSCFELCLVAELLRALLTCIVICQAASGATKLHPALLRCFVPCSAAPCAAGLFHALLSCIVPC